MGGGSLNSRLGDPNCASHSDLSISGGSPGSEHGALEWDTYWSAHHMSQGSQVPTAGETRRLQWLSHLPPELLSPYESAPRSWLPADRVPSPSRTAACSQLLLRLDRLLLCSLYEKAILSFQHLEISSLLYLCCVPCCRGPQSPLSVQHLHLLMVPAPLPLWAWKSPKPVLSALRRQRDDRHAHKAGFQYLLLGPPQH